MVFLDIISSNIKRSFAFRGYLLIKPGEPRNNLIFIRKLPYKYRSHLLELKQLVIRKIQTSERIP